MKIVRPDPVTDATLFSSSIIENDYAVYDGGTTYALGDYVISTTTHRVYRSVQAGNVGHDPTTDTTATWWLDTTATNRWRMFDDAVGVQSTATDSIAVTIVPASVCDSVVLLNVSASTVRVTMTSTTDGVVFDQTVSMVGTSGIDDWYSYFFEPVVRRSDLFVGDLPPYLGAQIAITLTDTGATVSCGECVVGLSREIGGTQYGARVGIRDFSVKQQDDFGNYTILERAYSKRGTFELWCDNNQFDEIQALLAGYRATPIAYIGSDDYAATVIYGFYKDFEQSLNYATRSICTLEIEGLT